MRLTCSQRALAEGLAVVERAVPTKSPLPVLSNILMATDEARPVLSGVLLTLEGDQLTLAAADGFRLAVRGVPLMDPVTEKLSLLVPARTLIELARVLDDTDDAVEIAATPNQNQILFR